MICASRSGKPICDYTLVPSTTIGNMNLSSSSHNAFKNLMTMTSFLSRTNCESVLMATRYHFFSSHDCVILAMEYRHALSAVQPPDAAYT